MVRVVASSPSSGMCSVTMIDSTADADWDGLLSEHWHMLIHDS